MPMDEAELAEARQANERYHDGYERRLAAEIVAMLPDREEAKLAAGLCRQDFEPGTAGRGASPATEGLAWSSSTK